MFSYQV